jgi:hypothetical protein
MHKIREKTVLGTHILNSDYRNVTNRKYRCLLWEKNELKVCTNEGIICISHLFVKRNTRGFQKNYKVSRIPSLVKRAAVTRIRSYV